VDLFTILVAHNRALSGTSISAKHNTVLETESGLVGNCIMSRTLKIMPAMVVPVFFTAGIFTPFFSNAALRWQRSKLKPPRSMF
jgi:hypothetical protein